MCPKFFEIEDLKNWKFEILEIEIFEINLKFKNFELRFWKLDFKIKNLNFIHLRFGNLQLGL